VRANARALVGDDPHEHAPRWRKVVVVKRCKRLRHVRRVAAHNVAPCGPCGILGGDLCLHPRCWYLEAAMRRCEHGGRTRRRRRWPPRNHGRGRSGFGTAREDAQRKHHAIDPSPTSHNDEYGRRPLNSGSDVGDCSLVEEIRRSAVRRAKPSSGWRCVGCSDDIHERSHGPGKRHQADPHRRESPPGLRGYVPVVEFAEKRHQPAWVASD
jgi:hypothetical protein